MAQYPYQHDSSSSSSDDESDSEDHTDGECRYRKNAVEVNRRNGTKITVYVWLRSCSCGTYNYQRRVSLTDLQDEDGKDVHYSKECKWRKKWQDGVLRLSAKCVCKKSGTLQSSYTGNSNCKFCS